MAALYILPAARGIALCTSPILVPTVMLPRRNSANLTSGHTSPRTTSGSAGDRRPLSLVTSQQPFRASTTQTFETESPQSQTSPQGTPPLPPLPPGGSGLRRQSTRRTTYETYVSAIDEHDSVPSQPANIMFMHAPPLPKIPDPPHTPMRFQQPAPGGSVGGFTALPSSHHESSSDYSHHNTTEYTYRFDTMPLSCSESGPPHYESADISGGIHANVWPTYNKISQQFDEKILAKWNTDLDGFLIFVSLMVEGDHCDSDRADANCRPPCSLPSLQPFLSGHSTTWNQIINDNRPYSFINY